MPKMVYNEIKLPEPDYDNINIVNGFWERIKCPI